MRFFAACAVLAILFLLAGCSGDSEDAPPAGEGPAWNHDPGDTDLGPSAWGEIDESFEQCRTSDAQSPVDIAGAVPRDLPALEFRYEETPLEVENTGHVIEVPMPEASANTLTIGDDEYRLVQFHFHAPSEHTLAGRSYEAEAHLVHESEEGELAVVGVLLEGGSPPSPLVELVVENAPEAAGDRVELEERDPVELLLVRDPGSADTGGHFTYSGSLTTPGCTEGVRWLVLRDTLGISADATARLHELASGFPGYDGYKNNNRPTQPLGDRVVERSD
jgi:carbonic anhydrase